MYALYSPKVFVVHRHDRKSFLKSRCRNEDVANFDNLVLTFQILVNIPGALGNRRGEWEYRARFQDLLHILIFPLIRRTGKEFKFDHCGRVQD